MTLLVVSPHLDDAVLSVGQLLAGHPDVTVATVFTADPATPRLLTEFDRRSGFVSSASAMGDRRMEDRRACSMLDVRWAHLGGVDGQYVQRGAATIGDVRRLLEHELEAHNLDVLQGILGPMGLGHPDHVVVADAALQVAKARGLPSFVYAELPYRVEDPWGMFARERELELAGWTTTGCFLGTGDRSAKRKAARLYMSQRWAVEIDHCLVPEITMEVTWDDE